MAVFLLLILAAIPFKVPMSPDKARLTLLVSLAIAGLCSPLIWRRLR
jgi:hypothetical protein